MLGTSHRAIILSMASTALAASLSVALSQTASANPAGASIEAGQATISAPSSTQLNVDQKTKIVIIDWKSFDIAAGETTKFKQPGADALAVNRIGGADPAKILGNLLANGRVVLIDGNGILFGPNAKVNVGALIATTSDAANKDILAGKAIFDRAGNPNAQIVNSGSITATSGMVGLVAPAVTNNGVIRARLGQVALGASNVFTVDFTGDGLITFPVDPNIIAGAIDANGRPVKALVANNGRIEGATVLLSARAAAALVTNVISTTGEIVARSISEKGGHIVLDPGEGSVALAGATLDASGKNGGGSIAVGSANAASVTADKASVLDASATQSGDGGSIYVNSGNTAFHGTAKAKGGSVSGNGGKIETSGHMLNVNGAIVDTSAPHGATGIWTLDPYDLTVDNTAASTIATNLATSNVTLQTTASSASGPGTQNASGVGDINIGSAISWSTANTLTLDAYHGINIAAGITASGAGKVVLTTNDGGTGGSVSFGLLDLGSTGKLSFTGTEGAGQSLTVNGTSYDLIYTAAELQAIGASTPALTQAQPYALAKSIDLSSISNFASIGSSAQAFTGTLDGLNNTVTGLTQLNPSGYGGLFGLTKGATLQNINLANIGITVTGPSAAPADVGSLVANANRTGSNQGTSLANIAASGVISVSGTHSNILIGGVAGLLELNGSGTNLASSVVINLTSTDVANTLQVGGLVGANSGIISRSFATGAVTGPATVGGFVGLNDGTITQSYATGAVSLNNPSATAGSSNNINGSLTLFAGGFAAVNGARGGNPGTISQSYATGSVSVNVASSRPTELIITTEAGGFAGGNTKRFVGDSINSGTLNEVFATGYVSGGTANGGLVGLNSGAAASATDGTITNSYWDTQTTGKTVITGDAGASTTGGLTTAQLQGTLPSGFNTVASGVWATGTGLFPYFDWRYASTPQAISGTAYSDSGVSVLQGGTVAALVAGTNVGSSATGANGYYYILAPSGTIAGGGSAVLAYVSGGNGGARAYTLTGTTTGFDIWGSTLIAPTADTTYSTASATTLQTQDTTLISTAVGSNTNPTTSLSQYGYIATSGFSIDQTLTLTGSNGLYVKTLAGDIAVSNAVSLVNGGLTLDAFHGINIDANLVASGSGKVALTSNDGGSGGDYNFAGAASLKFTGTEGSGQALTINGASYNLIYTAAELQAIGTDTSSMAQKYAIARDIDASGIADFAAIGSDTTPDNFTGILGGLNNTVDRLTSTGAANGMAGLFGWNFVGTLRDLKLTNVAIGGANAFDAGAAVAQMGATSAGTVSNVSVVGGTVSGFSEVGGLVGRNASGTISNSSAVGVTVSQSVTNMSSVKDAGGLVGRNDGTITQSYATGSVSSNKDAGGLVGYNTGTILRSYATGAVTLTALSNAASADTFGAGGFVGVNLSGTITDAYSMGSVTATNANSVSANLGGFAGANGGSINEAYTTGYVSLASGTGSLGAFTGATSATSLANATTSGTLTNTYYDSGTTGQSGIWNTTGLQGLPAGLLVDSTGVWNIGDNLYPYFRWNYASAPQAVQGTAYSNSGVTALKGGTVTVLVAGTNLGSASTGANGYYYVVAPSGTISGGGSAAVAYVSGGNGGARVNILTGTATGFDIWGSTLIAPTSTTNYTDASASTLQVYDASLIASAVGSNAAASTAVSGLSNYGYITNGSAFNIDQPLTLTSGLYVQATANNSTITISQALTLPGANGLLLSAIGAPTGNSTGAIAVDAPITVSGAGHVWLTAGNDNTTFVGKPLLQLSFAVGDSINYGSTNNGGTLSINGTAYTLLYGMSDVQSINSGLTGKYALATSLDATATSSWTPIGTNSPAFSGIFDGLGNTINNLTYTTAVQNAGLFGYVTGTVRNVGLVGGTVTGSHTSNLGSLVGTDQGLVYNAYSSASVSGTQGENGGLIGYINSLGAAANVFATGKVSGGSGGDAGGLAGELSGQLTNAFATGSVSGSYAGGLVSLLSTTGKLTNGYSTGYVVGTNTSGGLVSNLFGSGAITNGTWDTATSGVSATHGVSNVTNAGGVTGLTTSGLQASLPSGWSTSVWGISPGTSYPYLASFFPNGVTVISGTAYSSHSGTTALVANRVGLLGNGTSLGYAYTGANGYYYDAVPAGTLASGSQVLAYLSGTTTKGNTLFRNGGGGLVTGLDIYGGYLWLSGSAAALSNFGTSLSTALGSNSGSDFLFTLSGNVISLTSGANLEIVDNTNFSIDQAINTTGTVYLNMGGNTTQTASITAGGLALQGSRAGYTLTNASNSVGTLADSPANNHTLSFVNSGALTIGTIGSDVGIAGFTSVSITAGGNLTVSSSVSSTGATTLKATGNLTIGPSAQVSGGSTVTLSATGNFVNNRGSNAVSTSEGRWLIYSANPTGDTFGNLDSANTAVWNGTYATLNPELVTATGNRYIFANQPTLTFTTTNLSKTYGTDAGAAVATAYTVTGLNPGVAHAYLADTASAVYSGTPLLSSAGATSTATVEGGPYAINIAQGSVEIGGRYAVSFANTGTLTVNPLTVTITYSVADASSTYGTLATLGAVTLTGVRETDTANVSGVVSLFDGGSNLVALSAALNAGSYAEKVTSLTGSVAGNYLIANTGNTNGTLTINPKALTASLTGTVSKTYDGTLAATLADANYNLVGVLSGDTVVLNDPTSGVFDTKNAGIGKTVSVDGLLLSGASSGNYTLATTSISGAIGTITPAMLTASLTGTVSKTYDGTLAATLVDANYNLAGVVSGDTVMLNDPTSGAFDTKNAGTGKTVSVDGLLLSGASSGNYTLAASSISGAIGTITPATLTASLTGTVSKTYDGTLAATLTASNYALTGVVSGDTVAVTGTTAAYADKNVGTGKTVSIGGIALSGADAANYALSASALNGAVGTITPAPLVVAVNDASRQEGAPNPPFDVTVIGLMGGDPVSVLSGLSVSTAATLESIVGAYAIASSGGVATNYVIAVRQDGTLTVTPRPANPDVPGLNNSLPASNTNYNSQGDTSQGGTKGTGSEPTTGDLGITGASGTLICDVSNSDSSSESCRASK